MWLEQLEENPGRFLPEVTDDTLASADVVKVNLNQPMDQILKTLSQYPVKTRLQLTGTLVVARDIAHVPLSIAQLAMLPVLRCASCYAVFAL